MNTIFLEPDMVPATLRGTYKGKMFKAVVTTHVSVPIDAGLWSGGSRDVYSMIQFETGSEMPFPGQSSAPWDKGRREHEIQLIPGYAVVRSSMFCGKDMGLTFYVHPDNAAKLIAAPVVLAPYERVVLMATSRFKSSYGGQDRYQMAEGDYNIKRTLGDLAFPCRVHWDEAKQTLIARGLLLKSGAITPKGRNAVAR